MKVTIVGSGDAFGTGGKAHTCIKVDFSGRALLIDFGASSMTSFKALGYSVNEIEAIAITHLHGDHFGGLPFFLLDAAYGSKRSAPLIIAGPPGLRDRIMLALEALYQNSSKIVWCFAWKVREYEPGAAFELAGARLRTFPVKHMAEGGASGIRVEDGRRIFAFTGDSAWTTSLIELSRDADLCLMECYNGTESAPYHMDWSTLKQNLPFLKAKRIVLTHMNASAMACRAEMEALGLTLAKDGLSFDL